MRNFRRWLTHALRAALFPELVAAEHETISIAIARNGFDIRARAIGVELERAGKSMRNALRALRQIKDDLTPCPFEAELPAIRAAHDEWVASASRQVSA
jgi:hypothetical protein